MNIEEKIKNCRYCLKQINHFNPDPYYVDHFFKNYLQCVIDFFDEILEEANRDFGLYVTGKCTLKKFESRVKEKNDQFALEFLFWFNDNYKKEHETPYTNFMKNVTLFFKENHFLPKISIKMISNQRFPDDVAQEIMIGLKDGKLKSKEELQMIVKRQIPIFLESINQKRKINEQPKVLPNQVIASTFLKIKDLGDVEISQACEIYLQLMRRFLFDSRKKINQLTKRD